MIATGDNGSFYLDFSSNDVETRSAGLILVNAMLCSRTSEFCVVDASFSSVVVIDPKLFIYSARVLKTQILTVIIFFFLSIFIINY